MMFAWILPGTQARHARLLAPRLCHRHSCWETTVLWCGDLLQQPQGTSPVLASSAVHEVYPHVCSVPRSHQRWKESQQVNQALSLMLSFLPNCPDLFPALPFPVGLPPPMCLCLARSLLSLCSHPSDEDTQPLLNRTISPMWCILYDPDIPDTGG